MIEPFQGKKVKLILTGNFALTGTIDILYNDAIVFSTYKKTSLIHFERIREISPICKKGDNYE